MESYYVIERLRHLVEKEQELYGLYSELSVLALDEGLKDMLGHYAHEQYEHLCTMLEKYKCLVDDKRREP